MSDRPQRSLRPRKPFPYLPPDTQDPDLFGYSKLSYNKVKLNLMKEATSSINENNMIAKLLVKYVNNVNKCEFEQKLGIQQSKKYGGQMQQEVMIEKSVVEKSYQKIKNQKQSIYKVKISKKQQKEDQSKKQKQGNLKNNSMMKNNIRNEGYKGQKQNQSSNLFRQYGQYAAVINQLSEKGSINFDPNTLQHHIFLQSFPQNNTHKNSKTLIQQWLIDNQNQLFPNKTKVDYLKKQKQKEKQDKLFGRSAYHIAIAYHIHLKTIKNNVTTNKQGINADYLDPTFYAKKLKYQQIQTNRLMQNQV